MYQLSVVSIPVSDQQVSHAFYVDVLGFRFRGAGDQGTDHAWTLLMPPSGATGVTLIAPNAKQAPGSSQGLFLQTLDIESAHRRLAERGLAIGAVQEASWGRFATFADPDGNGWVLAEAGISV